VRLNTVSAAGDLGITGSAQNRARDFIVDGDPRILCPDNPFLFQRYALAVFYYSTRGDLWSTCSAPPDPFNEQEVVNANQLCEIEPLPNTGSDAWLTAMSECRWGGVVCDNNGIVERISIGKWLEMILA